MRYLIVCLIKGEALVFHEKLVEDVCSKFQVKRQRLPAHFTIKAPFETENIHEVEKLTEEFCKNTKAFEILVEDFGHFGNAVVYMDVKPSKNAVKVHDDYIDVLKNIAWLDWKQNEGKGRVFHCTVVSKLPSYKFQSIWQYVSRFQFHFSTYFNNISILLWEKNKWITYREFELKK
ncbi:2'-5' RNA ligase family protein [Clostridium sp. SYSU_GA19001]|uniref:2'-5' RNA ligase family protein n=1 Tax=Clostridium caldaquaticum TaxID=2940653 RepID=UPI0020776302|nr:2'-5' RNA ligase family protein [Clostridium caldaquaticum]MCM8711142.1 2'-5' RNA ligase family protein [Clostridium caldaquaticum]